MFLYTCGKFIITILDGVILESEWILSLLLTSLQWSLLFVTYVFLSNIK